MIEGDAGSDLDPVWEDMDRCLGQLFMMGFEGTHVTPQIKRLIQDCHIGSILLTAKNLRSAEQTTKLVYELQRTAFDAGHPVPLIISMDQENGGVNSLFDETHIRQFPSAMGIAATGSTDLAYEVSKATAQEIAACGINLIMGPCLDVLSNARSQPLGVRTLGDDPREVSSYSMAFIEGYKQAGIATMGKHFPSHGSLEFLGSTLDVPTITESLEQLNLNGIIPFRDAINKGLDAMLVGGCAMSSSGLNVMHACLSEQIVNDYLRRDLKFKGVVISDCLEIEALSHNIGVGGGTVMAVNAGCDLVLLCRSSVHQQEAIDGLKLGLDNFMINEARIRQSLWRVLKLKANCTSWEKALNPPGTSLLSQLEPRHTALSTTAYNSSITVVRDKKRLLPLTKLMEPEDQLLLLTPLVKPLLASAATHQLSDQGGIDSPESADWERSAVDIGGEQVFQEFGRELARHRNGRVLHASYNAHGVRPQHEDLIDRARIVIVVTADANRNLYQVAFTKHVAMLCSLAGDEKREKHVIAVATSSPYDFAFDQATIGTYLCTYDFTRAALISLGDVLCGKLNPTGTLPGTQGQSQKVSQRRQNWLVEPFREDRDVPALNNLISSVIKGRTPGSQAELSCATSDSFLLHTQDVLESHFVVRNSSTRTLFGFCSTYYFSATATGVIGAIFVDPTRRKLSIGSSLHDRAIRSLLQRKNIQLLQLGSRLPSIFAGSPITGDDEHLRNWFNKLGWDRALNHVVCSLVARNLTMWQPPPGKAKSLQSHGIDFDLVYGASHLGSILDYIKSSNRQGLAEVYKLALADPKACGIIRAKRSGDGEVVGTVVLCGVRSAFTKFVPALEALGPLTAAISSPVISPFVDERSTLVQALVMLGVQKIKQQGCHNCVLHHVDIEDTRGLDSLGFTTLHRFKEMVCDVSKWTRVPSPAG